MTNPLKLVSFLLLCYAVALQSPASAETARRIGLLPDHHSIKMEVITLKCSKITTNDYRLVTRWGADSLRVDIDCIGKKLITICGIVIRQSLQGTRFEHDSGFATLKPINSPNPQWRAHRSSTGFSLRWTTEGDAGVVYDHRWGEYKIILMPMLADDRWEEGKATKGLTSCGTQSAQFARTISNGIRDGKEFVTIEE